MMHSQNVRARCEVRTIQSKAYIYVCHAGETVREAKKKSAMHVMKREVVLALSLNHPETGSIRLD